MSNLTEGKQALRDGDLDVAYKKLMKALDHRPDDSELWWCVMLCKSGYRTDAELEQSLKAEYAHAAEAGEPVPGTPFDTQYCKNALRYATSTRRRDFVDRVSAELSDIWKEKTGRALRAPRTGVRPMHRSGMPVTKVAAYAATAAAAAGAGIGVYGVVTFTSWAMITGFVLFMAFTLAALLCKHFAKRSGSDAKYAFPVLVSLFVALCIGLIISGRIAGNGYVVVIAAVALALTALIGIMGAAMKMRELKKTEAGSNGKSSGGRSQYAPPAQKINKKDKEKKNDYQDAFD